MKRNTVRALSLLVGFLLGSAPFAATTGFQWQDIATLFGPLSGGFQLCFAQNNNGAPAIDNVSFRRLRVEDGTLVSTKTYSKATWTPASAGGFCLSDMNLTRYGHYVYEVQACAQSNCGPWELSTDPTYGAVNGKPRAWWVYAQAPDPNAPGGPSVTIFKERT